MKIQKLEKLNHARYRNFSWDSSLDAFSDKVNILFGWNGSGKTTLSNFLRSIEKGAVEKTSSFKIKTDSGSVAETDNLSGLKSNLRVFNGEYIDDVLRGSPQIPYIFFAGKDAVDYAEDENKLLEKQKELAKIVLPNAHDEIARTTALLIKGVTGINGYAKELTGVGTYSSYDKDDFKKRIKNIRERIAAKSLGSHTELLRADIDTLKTQLVNSDRLAKTDKDIADTAKWLLDNIGGINAVLQSSPVQEQSERIESLSGDQIAWVKEGVSLHFGTEETHDKCIFCESDIKNVEELLKHFSKEVVNTINSVDLYLRQIEGHTSKLSRLELPTPEQSTRINVLRSVFDSLSPILREKRNSVSDIKDVFTLDTKEVAELSSVKVVDATSTAYSIESHFVAEQYDAYEKACGDFESAKEAKTELENEVKALEEHVRTLKQKAKSTHESASALNEIFKVAFPYRKIEITDNDEGTGYVLKRDGSHCPFSTLSEGEKNLIALTYFIHSINDAQDKLPDDGIVLIDDPVSSLDKQAIFQIFSIITSEMKKHTGRQYFVLTHNLDFLGHLKEFYDKAIGKKEVRLFGLSATDKGCTIGSIHPLLKNHKSDYYYVFSLLHKFKDSCEPEDSYLIVNLLRRWLETFLAFKFASSGDFNSTLESAYIEANKITSDEGWNPPFTNNHLEMYRFINHGSHGFHDTESVDDSMLAGASERIKEAFKLVQILDALHYKKLGSMVAKTD